MDADRLAWLRQHTRARILAAAEERFASVGFDAARVSDVASTAGVSKSHLYYHFDSKASLLECLIELRTADLLEAKDRLFAGRAFAELMASPRELADVLERAFTDVLTPHRAFIRIVLVESIRNPVAARPVFAAVEALLDDMLRRFRVFGTLVDETRLKRLALYLGIIPSLFAVALDAEVVGPSVGPEGLAADLAGLEALLIPVLFKEES
jgi:AcrR family transcriptional regulator